MKNYAVWLLALLVAVYMPGCVEALETPESATSSPTPIISLDPSETASATATARQDTATATLTDTPMVAAPTLWTEPPTTYPTPTPLGTPSPGIIIVTAIGDPPTGYYYPNAKQNIRTCADVSCTVYRVASAGAAIRIYDLLVLPGGDMWLAVDPVGNLWIAYYVGGSFFGEWDPDN